MKASKVFEDSVACIVKTESQRFTEILNNHAINLNSKGNKGWSLLHYAAQYNALEIADFLIKQGAEVNSKDEFGNNVLWRATFASNGKGDLIKLLIANGADKFEKNIRGISPIELANTISNYNVNQYF